LNWR